MRIVFSIIPLCVCFTIILLSSYLAALPVSAPSSSYGVPSLGYGIQELTYLSSNDGSGSGDAVLSNTTAALSSNSSTIVYETEAFIAPPSVKTFVIYMANEFHENWPEESHKLLT
ncbi:MAG: hypothetical protein M3115_01265, partial [Thermoproteota archaeon]|nr:hypothetical protein [Thermoproteota archaeon]